MNTSVLIPILAACITVFGTIVIAACVLCHEPAVVRIRRIGK